MKKIQNHSGFTLIEMLVALVIMICLVIGISVGMDAGSRIYSDAIFEADSANLAGILNTAIGDILRYSKQIKVNDGKWKDSSGTNIPAEVAPFVFTSSDYGIGDAYFVVDTSSGVLQMKNLRDAQVVELINSGSYPNLRIQNFVAAYHPAERDLTTDIITSGGYFTVSYEVCSSVNSEKVRQVESIVRLMNN